MARVPYEVPLSAKPQTFSISLGGVVYYLTLRWNVIGKYWVLDIADDEQVPLILGIPVVTGVDLLGQFRSFNFNGWLIAQTDGDADAVPTFDNLGTAGRLYFVVVTTDG